MNNYIDKIHELIEKVNPQLYVDSSNLTLMTYLIIAGIIFGIGILLSILFKIFPKFNTLTGDFGDDYKALFFGVPLVIVILVVMSYCLLSHSNCQTILTIQSRSVLNPIM